MTQAKPSGQMGNPRRYASQPNRRFIKDATTGEYHENLCYVGPKGGGEDSTGTDPSSLSSPKSSRKGSPNTPGSAVNDLADQMGWDLQGKLPKMLDPFDFRAEGEGQEQGQEQRREVGQVR